jgi:hypothetical protein
MTWSLVFVLMLISIFIVKIQNVFRACVEEGCSAFLRIAYEKTT